MDLSVLAGVLGSPIVKTVLDKTASFLEENYELQSSVKTNLARLKDSLVVVLSVVEAAEKQQIQDVTLNNWLLDLKDLAYEADDLIDTFEYQQLEQKVERKSSVQAAWDAVKRLLLPDDETKELNSLVERLERHASNVGNFNQLLRLEGQSQKHADISEQQRTPSCSLPFEHSFVGREMEKVVIINILLRTERRRGARNVPVLPILGVGGVGKTTLAQVVYNDEKVKKHFSLRMWVCVSESFDVTRITRDILEQADHEANYSGITSFKRLQYDLELKLISEKFLLVLDDIWNETEKTSWDKLKAPLCYGKDGSMILLTSRLPEVAKLMGTVDPIKLEGLPAYEYWSLFKEQSFRGANPEEHPGLEAIGKKIASKLKGSLLAAKTMGALLNDKLDADHWISKIWELENGQDGIMSVLRLCYLYLPAHLRQCFAYLSIFPKKWQFERDDVISMWMAQGMIYHDKRTKGIEDVGNDYFNELISKSFFQPVNRYTDKYTIHDLLHYLAESVSKDDCFRNDGDEFRTIPTTIRHLYLNEKHLARLIEENTVVLEKLRTLILDGDFFANPNYADLRGVLIRLRKIRLLDLRQLNLQKCPENLSSLIHLRYLYISGHPVIKKVPELTKLYHLQTLHLDGLLGPLPAGISKLINRRHCGFTKLPKLQMALSCPSNSLSSSSKMAQSVVAGIFGSPTLQVLLDKTTSLLGENYELQSSVKTNLARMKDSLVAVQRVVKAAEKQQIQDQKLNNWLLDLKDLAYETDDLIDTFEYQQLEQKVERKSSVKSVLSPDDEIKELSFLVEQLERHASNVGNFIQLLRLEGQSQKHADISEQQRTPSCSLPFEHTFVGREMEKEAIINILLRTEPCGARNVPVLPILGVGGVGKTTLAQVVYNDEKVKKHFSLRMWVCVSESFAETRITRDILEQADREANYSGITSFKTLQENLQVNLISEKFLLVLDDIWNETARRLWGILTTSLCYGKDGSMILLTSRLPEVAELMGAMYPIILRGLPEDEYWSLFKEQSFRGTNPKEHPRLEAIGKKIASKLEGSPLAAMTLGALLNDKLHVDHWESIFESKICELEKGQDGIMSVLRLCYLYLPAHLRQCFAYLSIFPKDWQFERDDVIRMWMAQGMIHHDNWTKRIEDVGKDYFNELISKSFFQPVNRYTDKYTIHDLLHYLAESASKDDCFRIDGDEFRTIPTTIRHLYLNEKHLARLIEENTVVLKKLLTLILHGNFSANPNADLQDVLIQLKKIRLLALRRCNLQKCHNVSNLIHLRYLDLPCSGSEEVPEELHKLYHLQTIELCKLRADCVLAGISNLINLRHFICHEDVISMVPGIGKLTCLQKLTMFRVQRDLDFQIVQLKDLRELCGRLNIENLDCVESKEEAEEAKLCEKGYLEELCLVWRKKKSMKLDEVEVGILEGLRPNPNLKWLIIDGYRGTLSPSWMVRNDSLVNLVSLTISNCRAWKELPPLGQLLWLKELRIFGMDAVKEVGTGFHGKDGFPSLELLILKDFSQWEEWSPDEKVILFPHLVRFQIRGCPRLQSIPPLPTTLEELTLEDIGLTILPNLQMASSRPLDSLPSSSTSSLSSSLKTLTISNCVDKMSVGEWFPQHHNNLVDVSIGHGHERKPLLLNGFNKLIALERLNIGYCNIFVTSDTEEDSGLLPPSLEYLHLKNCFVADNIMLKCLQGLSSLESLGISMLPKIMTISFPEGLTRLKTLQISGCEELSSIASFKNLPSLQNLSITFCPKIPFILGLEHLTELKRLEISNCKELSSIPGREALPKLNEYIVDGCQKICMKDAGLPILPKSKSVVAGIFGSYTLQVLLDKTTSLLGENYELQSSVKTNLEKLKDSLVAVQRVLKAAEKQQIQDGNLNDWLLYLKERAYEADDLIDTFEYQQLKQKVEGKSSVKSVLSPDDEIKELSFLVEQLERHASNVGNFIQLLRLEGQSQKHADISEQQRTPSCSLPFEHTFVGREMEKEAIINILLRTEPCGARNVPVLPILGVGGIGKTTLAQVVYNDEKVKKHFSLRMWVCVSESFDETRITRDILEQADREANYSGITSFKTLQENLEVNLISEKFLLVLDDIWNETARRLWGILTTSLCYGKDGSMILLTSRLPEVAELMGAMYPIILRGLPEDEYWSLFKEQSFRGTNPKEHPRLEAIGKKIASKLKGSPLAAKTLGALLNDKLHVDHWESISESMIWELEKGQDGIMSVLRLCYLYLPARLRQCFAYLSIFPKNWQFERDDVIRMWMAQGMIHHNNRTRRTEDVGKDYFNALISKSFFQPVNRYTDKYTIHDLLHSLAESFSKDDCFRIDGDEFRSIPTTIRHLYLDEKHLAKLKKNKFVLEKLRTLIVYNYSTGADPNDADLKDVLIQLRKIRLLALRRLHLQKCPDNLSSLIHLRYLDLSLNHEIKKLPDELTMLYHLQCYNPTTLGLVESSRVKF